jgi:acetyl-CoA/propionyl-CoA carboxylase biotin carboxyl carrier protein
MDEELSPSQAAARIGATTRSVQRWIASGRLSARRVGGRWRVASGVIDAFVAGEPRPGLPQPPIRAVFIANRGEIAARISRACRRLALRAIMPATDGPGALDLLDSDAVVAAALDAGADALHPGFGFLAENADFAEAVIASGIRWVGPPPAAIRTMGDKAAARRLAASLGVPVLAGYDDPDQSDIALVAAAERIGFPLLVKPAAGGGGKGMRTVRGAGALPDAIAAARREAAAAFGDDRLILEHLVVGARHVEIQVLFDQHGAGISLGERDCSIQRRHQKILEESPSPAVDEALRARLGEASLTLARAVGYVGAGTCEYLLDGRGRATFLEMNTRLQVEHPVTELVTGRDLVADQLDIAAGQPLRALGAAVAAREPAPGGHAVEVRLYAEDAEDGFLPAIGRVHALRWPTGDGIRVDAGIELGSDIGGRFDPMLAKIIAWGPDRTTSFERLAGALDRTVVLGVVTNLRFLRWLVRQPVVLAGDARTDVLTRIWPPDSWADETAIPAEAWSVAADALLAPGDAADPWAGGWRLNAARVVRLEADGQTHLVDTAGAPAAPGEPVTPALELVRVGDTVHVDLAGRSVAFRLAPPPDVDAAARTAIAHGVAGASGPVDVIAPMPGAVLTIHAAVGDDVAAGDPIVTLEAMKMEHAVVATMTGRIGNVLVAPADQVTRGQLLATIEP